MPDRSAPPINVPPLGELEIAVLEHVWESGETSVKDAHGALGKPRGISLNTVQSTLERLHRKQLLTRRKASHAFRYQAGVQRSQLVAGLIQDVLGRFGGDEAASLAAFVEVAERFDEPTLTALESLLRERRQQAGNHE